MGSKDEMRSAAVKKPKMKRRQKWVNVNNGTMQSGQEGRDSKQEKAASRNRLQAGKVNKRTSSFHIGIYLNYVNKLEHVGAGEQSSGTLSLRQHYPLALLQIAFGVCRW